MNFANFAGDQKIATTKLKTTMKLKQDKFETGGLWSKLEALLINATRLHALLTT